MDIMDLRMEIADAPDDQLTYDVVMNVGSEADGDYFVPVGEIEWQHNEKRIIIQPLVE